MVRGFGAFFRYSCSQTQNVVSITRRGSRVNSCPQTRTIHFQTIVYREVAVQRFMDTSIGVVLKKLSSKDSFQTADGATCKVSKTPLRRLYHPRIYFKGSNDFVPSCHFKRLV
ncbi:hypothetical protein AVEN_54738-1 [Araneus ventricosus]|uniref:Uncharacterized protein n=1 Tax=Araneus ventricosus TaxID=182803 RepID=A0A4Y2FEI7_ARAVE|nr:hypothetical protein AVEN_54738-1 [Araneus ventricosus]